MKSLIIRFFALGVILVTSISCSTNYVDLEVIHTKPDNLLFEIDSAMQSTPGKVKNLIIKGDAYLSAVDCKAIKKRFTNKHLDTLDISQSYFVHHYLPDTKKGAFSKMKMQAVKLPTSLHTIGYRAFKNCKNLKYISFPETVKVIGNEAFAGCINLQVDGELPNSIYHIGQASFKNCKQLKLTKLPEDLRLLIRPYAFANTKVDFTEIPSGVTVLKEGVFKNTFITKMSFPNGFEEIGSLAFQNCKLQELSFNDTIAPWSDTRVNYDSFKGVKLANVIVNLPVGAKDVYQKQTPWINLEHIVESKPDRVYPLKNPRKNLIMLDGLQREYLVYLPQNEQKNPDGLIIMLHALDETMYDIIERNNIMMIADDINMVLVAPQAVPIQGKRVKKTILKYYPRNFSSSLIWNAGVGIKGMSKSKTVFSHRINKSIKDLDFLHAIQEQTIEKYQINRENIFVFGISMGGCMAYQYALHYGDDITGLINIAGTMGVYADTAIATANIPIPILDIHSTTDEIIPYNGVHHYKLNNMEVETRIGWHVDEVIAYWSKKNQTQDFIKEFIDSKGGISVEKYTYYHPENPVIHYQIRGGRHATELVLNKHPISYRNEILSFILEHKK